MKKLLFVNACVHRDVSRTNRIASALIDLLVKEGAFGEVNELVLEEANIQALNSASLGQRNAFIEKGDYSSAMFNHARTFANAHCIVMAAPYWEFAFPAMLKNYLEAISVVGLTYNYDSRGIPAGRCRGAKIYYVTTSGGHIGEFNYGYEQVKTLSTVLFGIKRAVCVSAEGLDIIGNDAAALVDAAIADLGNKI